MKKILYLFGLVTATALASCGGANETKNEEKEVVCDCENSISITVNDDDYAMDDTLVYNTPNFEVKHAEYTWINDSSVTLKMCNYEPSELAGAREEYQIDLSVELHAKNGKKIVPGYYGYLDFDNELWSGVTMTTACGTEWFKENDKGGIILEYADEDAICGTFNLNVEGPNSPSAGIVRIEGTFVYKK